MVVLAFNSANGSYMCGGERASVFLVVVSIYVWFCCSRRLADEVQVLDVYSPIVHSKMSEDAEMRV